MLHNVARLSRQANLPNGNFRPELQAARVNQRKLAPVPVGIAIDAVARGTRQIFYNGDPIADHSIKKGGFANIRSAHNSYKRLHYSPSTLSLPIKRHPLRVPCVLSVLLRAIIAY